MYIYELHFMAEKKKLAISDAAVELCTEVT
jgi:hypothetical protein